MPFTRLVDAWQEGKECGDLPIGREGSARLDLDLATPSPHTRNPEPVTVDPTSRPGLSGWLLGGLLHREPDLDDIEVES